MVEALRILVSGYRYRYTDPSDLQFSFFDYIIRDLRVLKDDTSLGSELRRSYWKYIYIYSNTIWASLW